MKKKKLNLRNYIVRGLTYAILCIGAETTIGILVIGLVEKLF